MADKEHLEILGRGVDAWNQWRKANPEIRPDLSGAHLINRDLSRADFDGANLAGADLSKAQLSHATLHGANLESSTLILADLLGAVMNKANLSGASFFGAFLFGTRLKSANLRGSNLLGASLMGADLTAADLTGAHLMGTNFHEANLQNSIFKDSNLTAASLVGSRVQGTQFDQCNVHGISAWNLEGTPKLQRDLILTQRDNFLTVGSLELAQIINPILFSSRGFDYLQTISIRAGLVIGRFKASRKQICDAIRDQIEAGRWTPILAELESPGDRKSMDYLVKLTKMVGLVLLDLTGLKPFRTQLLSLKLQELSLPVVILREAKAEKLSEFEKEDSPTVIYKDLEDLNRKLKSLASWISSP